MFGAPNFMGQLGLKKLKLTHFQKPDPAVATYFVRLANSSERGSYLPNNLRKSCLNKILYLFYKISVESVSTTQKEQPYGY